MEPKFVSVNGREYQTGLPYECPLEDDAACGQMPAFRCDPFELAPSGEERAKQIEKIIAPLKQDAMSANLLTDIFFYVPEKKQVCHAAVQTPPGIFKPFPRKAEEITEIAGLQGVEVLGLDREEGKRELSKLTLDIPDKPIKELLEKVLERLAIVEGKYFSYEQFRELSKVMPDLVPLFKKLIRIERANDPKNPEMIQLTLRLVPIPDQVNIGLDITALDEQEVAALQEAISAIVKQKPEDVIALMQRKITLHDLLARYGLLLDARYTPRLREITIVDDAVFFGIQVDLNPPQFVLTYSQSYFDEYLSTRPQEERDEAAQFLGEVAGNIGEPRNMQQVKHQMMIETANAKEGWKSGKRSYELSFVETRVDGRDAIIATRVPVPTSFALVGDFPQQFRKELEAIFRGAVKGRKVNMAKVDQATKEAKEFLKRKGLFLKPSDLEFTPEGELRVHLDCRRWSQLYAVDAVGEASDDAKRAKRAELIKGIIDPYRGEFITAKDLQSVKNKLARGLNRKLIQENFSTDRQTGDTVALFVAAEDDLVHIVRGSGGGGADGFLVDLFYALEDGTGNTYSIGAKTWSKWSVFKSRDIKDTYLQSIRLGFGTFVGPKSQLNVDVYAYNAQNGGESQTGAGADITYKGFELDDKLTLSLGLEGGYLKVPKGTEGYTDIPAKLRPHAGICYADDGLEICLDTSVSTIASNHASAQVSIKHTTQLTDDLALQLWAGAGGMIGKASKLEQFNQGSINAPFNMSFFDPKLTVGTYYVYGAAGLSYALGYGFSIQPIVVSAMLIGKSAKMTVGSCVSYDQYGICVGYQQGLVNASSNVALSINAFRMPLPSDGARTTILSD